MRGPHPVAVVFPAEFSLSLDMLKPLGELAPLHLTCAIELRPMSKVEKCGRREAEAEHSVLDMAITLHLKETETSESPDRYEVTCNDTLVPAVSSGAER
jgi:hypothetical protein